MASTIVQLMDVERTYPSSPPVRALRPCTVRVERGEHVVITGRSGSGKSTLLSVLGLLDEPTAGKYILDGTDTSLLSERQRCSMRAFQVGFVFQSFHLMSYRSAVDNVETGLLYNGVARRDRRRQAIAVLERVGLADRALATPNEMSGGECQRVAIARAIVRRPSLVLCDEPTGNLDTASARQVLELLDELNRDGLTVIVITHDDLVASHATRTLNIEDGTVTEGLNIVTPESAQT